MPIFEVEANGRAFEVDAPSADALQAALPRILESAGGQPVADGPDRSRAGKGSIQTGPDTSERPGLLTRARDLVTGELRTEYPDAPEFAAAMRQVEIDRGGRWAPAGTSAAVRGLSSITPDARAQVDIIRRQIPDLEEQTDVHGNIMLRAPSVGVTSWTYLNRPGLTTRDVDEFMSPAIATAPLAPGFGAGTSVLARLGSAAGVGAAGSVLQDVAAIGLGSNQGVDPLRAGVSGVISAPFGLLGGRPAARTAAGGSPRAGAVADDVPTPPPQTAAGEPPSPQPAQTAGLGLPEPAQPPPGVGAPFQIVTPDGSMTVTAVPEVVELSSLRLARGDLQPRDRAGRSEYALGARERAKQLDPERLLPARVSDSGAPVVMADGTVLSGNGRIMSINEVYSSPALAARAAAYRARLGPAAAGMQRPVMVMRLGQMSRDDAARFADLSNRPAVAAMSITERAARDARALGDDALGLYQGGDFEAPQNFPFLRAFLERAVTPAERGAVSMNNRLTREGADRMRAAVMHAAYDDSSVISRLLESTDDNLRGITSALVDAAPAMAQLRADIRAGLVPAEMDATEMLGEAVRLLGDLRSRGITPQRHFAQADAFPSTNPMAAAWVRALYTDDLSRPLSRPQMAAVLRAYADEARLHRSGGLFPDETTDAQILAAARARAAREHGGEAPSSAPAPPSQAPAAGADPAPAPQPGGQQGAMDAASESLGPRELPRQPRGPLRDPLTAGISDELRQMPERPGREQIARASQVLQERFGDEPSNAKGLTAGQVPRVVGNGIMAQRAASGVSATFVGAPLAEAARDAVAGLGRVADRIVRKVGSGGQYSPGEAARSAVGAWIAGKSQDTERALYDAVGRLIRRDGRRPLTETRPLVAVLKAEQQAATTTEHQLAIDTVQKALDLPEGLTYDGLRRLRTRVRSMLDDSLLPEGGTVKPGLERVHAALTRDLRATVHKFGGDKAVEAFDLANSTAREFALRRKSLAKLIGEKGDVSPERVLSRIVDMAGSGAGGDVARLAQIKSVVQDGWDEVVSGVLAKIMTNPDGTFSPAQFVRRYGRLSQNGKTAIFGGELRESLDALATVSTQFDQLNRLGNPSGTGNVFALFGGGFFMGSNPLSVLAALGGGALFARLMARPLTAKATVRWAQAYAQASSKPSPATALLLQQLSRQLEDALTNDEGSR